MSRDELARVEIGAREWDTEYAQVTNATLPFEHCALHAGGEGWGKEGVTVGDLQMRAYLGDWTVEQLHTWIHDKGFVAARKLSAEATLKDGEASGWHYSLISYPRFYEDYGGIANVAFYSRRFGTETVVLVFMYAYRSQEEVIQTILSSFSHP